MTDYKHIKRWTLPQWYMGATWPDYYSAGVGRSRDSDCLEESNFHTMLKELGGESETVVVVRENHCLVGWVEWLAIHDSDEKSLAIADRQMERLESYPVLDENDLGEREQESADTAWRECYSPQERIDYIRKNRGQFEFHDFADMLACVRGQYFSGYASELAYA
jgi:hypothetical protein